MTGLISCLLQSYFTWFLDSPRVNAKRYLKLFKALFASLRKEEPTFKTELFQVGLPCYSWDWTQAVRFSKRQENEKAFLQKHSWRARMFPQCFPVSHMGNNIVSYAYATRHGILTKIRACEHFQEVCDCGHEQASTHLIFASNSSKGQILRAFSNWMGPFDTPNKQSRDWWGDDQLSTNPGWLTFDLPPFTEGLLLYTRLKIPLQ